VHKTGVAMKSCCTPWKESSVEKTLLGCFPTILLAFFVSPAWSQTLREIQSPASTPEPASSVTTNVNEVSLDLVVHDKRSSAVLDLKPEDMVVTDNDVPVKLSGFRLVRGEAAQSRGHLVTLVFDPFRGPTALSARIIAEKILTVLPAEGYSFAVLDFKSRLRLIQAFTQDREAVVRAVHVETESHPITLSTVSEGVSLTSDKEAEEARTKTAAGAEKNLIAVALTGVDASGLPVGVKERAQARTLMTALNDSQAIAQEQRARLSLAGLLALVKSQESVGDRKVLIYFTQNQQLDAASKKLLSTISGAAARAGVTIYTVDMDTVGSSTKGDEANAVMNGLNPATGAGGVQEGSAPIQGPASPDGRGNVWGPQQDIQVMTDFMRSSGEDRTDPFADTKSPMADFSKATGGAYIDGMNSTKKPLQQMVQDLSTYYQASYVPPFKEYDGKFRTIAVKPVRAGLTIKTKTGYFALAAGADAGIQPFEGPLLKSFEEARLPTDLKFHAAVLRFGDLPDGNSNTIAVEVPLAELETKADAKTNLSSAHVSIVAQIKDASGAVIEHYSEDITKRAVRETLDRDRAATISLARHFISVPGKYTMEVGVLDQNSGKAGAERSDFEIPDVAGAVSLSDMVLVRKVEGSHTDEDDPLEPLRYEHQKVTPNLAGELPAHSHEVSLFFILHPDPASSEPMALEMELIHDGKAGKRTPLLHADGVKAPMPYLASIGSHALAPGEYVVKAYIKQGSKTAVQTGSFSIAGAPVTEVANADSEWFNGISIDGDQPSSAPPQPANQLAIVAPAKPTPAPPQEEAQTVIEAARERALSFNESLPDFVCTEVTKRSVDMNGNGKWKLRDTLVELLNYRERVETRTTLEVNGKVTDMDRQAMKGTFSAGEFGGVLQAVFRDGSHAEFKWKETDQLNGGAVEVYDYRVDRSNSTFSVTGSSGKQLVVGFHGQVFIDSATRRARRVTLTADDLPSDFPTHATEILVDYDYVKINGLNYLLPVSAELRLKQGRNEASTNTMEFRDYKRFAAQ
jgi:VWFA-related protein